MNAGVRYQTDVKYDQTLTDCLRCYRGRAVKSVHSFFARTVLTYTERSFLLKSDYCLT